MQPVAPQTSTVQGFASLQSESVVQSQVCWPTQAPVWQVSFAVQLSPSSQPTPVSGRLTHPTPETHTSSVQAFPYLFNGKAGVSFALKSVQFIRNGEPLGGSAPEKPENVFDVVEVDDNEAYGDLI